MPTIKKHKLSTKSTKIVLNAIETMVNNVIEDTNISGKEAEDIVMEAFGQGADDYIWDKISQDIEEILSEQEENGE